MLTTANFLHTLDDLASGVREMSMNLQDQVLVWMSQNRDFGEDERYREKDDVDTSLITSAVITAEREAIEGIFGRGVPLDDELADYGKRLHDELSDLHCDLIDAATNGEMWSASQQVSFWTRFAERADVDNAHAMYLSSGNWDFGVFDNVLKVLMDWAGDDGTVLSAILTAGMSDVRTAIYDVFGTTYAGLNRDDFIAAVRANDDWCRPGGYVAIMCFGAATGHRGRPEGVASGDELAERFEGAVQGLARKHPGSPVAETAAVYRQLYDLRRRYDTYEYFGAYGFYRNLAIHRLGSAVEPIVPDLAEELRYLATTYQFAPVLRALRRIST